VELSQGQTPRLDEPFTDVFAKKSMWNEARLRLSNETMPAEQLLGPSTVNDTPIKTFASYPLLRNLPDTAPSASPLLGSV
jgi:hypothetical protein